MIMNYVRAISGFFRFLARGPRHNQPFQTSIRSRLAAATPLRFVETAIIGLIKAFAPYRVAKIC
jgi:hypothetical protein